MPPKKAAAASAASAKVMAYCVKCKAKREMKDAEETKSANGRKMMKGVCSVCGTKMNLFMKD